MSSTAPIAQRGPALGRALRPRLRLLLPPIRTGWRPSFVSTIVFTLVACLAALLGINIALTRGAYTEQQLTLQQTALMEEEQAMHEKVARDSAPEVLAQRARDLGMIPNSSPAFIRMSDGKVLGVPTPATIAQSPAFSDLAGQPLTPEQQAAAAAAANGGVAAVGVDGLAAGQVVMPGDPAQLNPAELAAAGQATTTTSAAQLPSATVVSPGTGESTDAAATAPQQESQPPSGDGAVLVGGAR